jgi:hypothetical protein
MSALPLRRYRVVVLEWLSHVAVIEAQSRAEAEAQALDLWNRADGSFSFEDQGIDGVIADELPEANSG